MDIEAILTVTGLDSLGKQPSPTVLQATLGKLARMAADLQGLDQALLREAASEMLKSAGVKAPKALLNEAFSTTQPLEDPERPDPARSVISAEPEPWGDPVSGAKVLDEVSKFVRAHAVLPPGSADAIALWIAFTYVDDTFLHSPILAVISPEMRCGKSTVMTVLRACCYKSMAVSHATVASIFRAIEAYKPTLLLDEADVYIRSSEDFRGILNSGHERHSATVLRSVGNGDDYEPGCFSTWAPKAVAAIGDLPATVMDRSIVLRMRRKKDGEGGGKPTVRELERVKNLPRKLAKWASEAVPSLSGATPALPEGLHDRARDNWAPLLAIADSVGGSWPDRARQSALVLSGGPGESISDGVQLLVDIKTVFDTYPDERIKSEDLIKRLGEMEDRPWPEWRSGRPITKHQLAALLRPFNVTPRKIRFGESTVRGYTQFDFQDAWSRYLPPAEPEHPEQSSVYAVFASFQSGTP